MELFDLTDNKNELYQKESFLKNELNRMLKENTSLKVF
jgi:regulator of replication initiation timing